MIASEDSISLTVECLPVPINHLYPTGPHGKRFKTPKAKELLALMALELRGQRFEEGEAFAVSMFFQVPKDGKKHDVDGYIKHPLDCLVDLQVIPDDDLVLEVIGRKGFGDKPLTQLVITRLA